MRGRLFSRDGIFSLSLSPVRIQIKSRAAAGTGFLAVLRFEFLALSPHALAPRSPSPATTIQTLSHAFPLFPPHRFLSRKPVSLMFLSFPPFSRTRDRILFLRGGEENGP